MQLLLPITKFENEKFSNFHQGNNSLLINSLHKNFATLNQRFFYIWGGDSMGKSHLLKACCNELIQQGGSAIYIPLSNHKQFSHAVLENLEQQDLVCLDDLQAICGNQVWEEAVFNLFNRIKENPSAMLIISANQSPYGLNINLPDLGSRLTWGEIYQLQELTDQQKSEVLQQIASDLGVELSVKSALFLIRRMPRDLRSLISALHTLNEVSLQNNCKLSIPKIKEFLDL